MAQFQFIEDSFLALEYYLGRIEYFPLLLFSLPQKKCCQKKILR